MEQLSRGDSGQPGAEDKRIIQQGPFSLDDLTPYRGMCVSIRDGRVVDSATDFVTMRNRGTIGEGDIALIVRTNPDRPFIGETSTQG